MLQFHKSAFLWRYLICSGVAALALHPLAFKTAAAETATFAHSRHHNVEIDFADPAARCAATDLHLKMAITPESHDIGAVEQQIHLANALGRKLATDHQCAAVQSVDIAVIQNGSEARHLQATKGTNWQFAEVAASQPAPQPQPSPPLPPVPDALGAAAVTAPPAPAADAPAPTAVPAQAQDAAPAAPPPPPVVLPEGYMGLLALLVRHNPALLDNENIQACWARHAFQRDFFAAQGNEFRKHEVENRARTDLAQISQQIPAGTLQANLAVRLGEYDFKQSSFPVALNGNVLTLSSTCDMSDTTVPGQVGLKLGETAPTFRLPMPAAEAEQFLKQRTRFGFINREMMAILTFHVEDSQLGKMTDSTPQPVALTHVKIYSDTDKTSLLADIGPDALENMRKAQDAAKAAQQAKEAAQQQAENRRRMAERVQNASRSEKLAMWVGQNTRGFNAPDLNTIRNVRARAMMQGAPVDAILLVQADGSGRAQVPTKWPGKLNLTTPKDQPALSSGTWYLVQGPVSVPEKGDFPAAEMTVQTLHACQQDQCKDAEDPQALLATLQPTVTP
ncbi:DUF4852 domain-containing protein [Acetobacter cibinongensis]|uniref:DUF4852 domain-containing protein n=1 Tax=Acetobacter cibinongensis TaxID=146475 RepID=A0A1Z5YZA0_9PROT|nr:DUF4852 domain-containing protein [Acetobacter cibinongensis]OUJ04626.1 hypothetical protein HK14_00280 [Acetobacter cibinongensis]